jgi:tripartite-type tricarboxylate transporter receptor subunit TctC
LKALAISALHRATLAPDVPTIAEAGYPDFKAEVYYVILAPVGIPQVLAELLEREVRTALRSSGFQEKFKSQNIEVRATTGAEAEARIKADTILWARVVKAANMHVE